MKKRIFSMILVVVMLTLSLAGCAYSYEKDDVSKYAAIDVDAFKAALEALKIDDADFGIDETKRQEKVRDAIIKSLASLAEGDDKGKTSGTIGANDVVYYCFYVTGEVGEEGAKTPVIVYASSMIKSTSDNTKLQLGLASNEGRDKAIAEALAGVAIEDDKAFTVIESGKPAEAGNLAIVTYTKKVGDGADVKYTNDIIPLKAKAEGADKATSFEEYLVGLEVGKEYKDADDQFVVGDTTYSNIKITQAISKWTEVTATYTLDKKTEVEAVGKTEKVDLKDVELTAHVFPVKFDNVVEIDSADYNATLILKELLGYSMNAGTVEVKDENGKVTTEAADGTLDIFTDNGYKNGEELMNDIAKKLVEYFGDLSEAEDELEDAEGELEDAEKALEDNDTTENKNAVETAKTAVADAKKAVEDAEKKVDDQIKKLLECKKGETSAADTIVTEYKNYRYESLETSYKNSIIQSLAAAVHEAAVANIKYTGTLPKKAVKEAYDRIMNNYEYSFYEGTVSGGTTTNFDANGGDINVFLRDQLDLDADATKDDIKAAINAEAETAVKDTLVVYALKEVCEAIFPDVDFDVTDEDVDEFKQSYHYLLLQYSLGTSDVDDGYYMPALQFDNVLDYLMEVDESSTENKIKFNHINYDFKE